MTGEKIITVPNLSSWLMAAWGAVCANPYSDLFDKNPTIFRPMDQLMPEFAWGSLMFCAGVAGLLFGYFGHRRITARLMFAVYAAFALLYALGDYSQPGAYFFASIAMANLWIREGDQWTTRG